MFWALFSLFGLVAALKRLAERAAQRVIEARKRRRAANVVPAAA
jgi:hypothetical protein